MGERNFVLGGLSIKAVVAEMTAMCLFVYIGCGTATTFSSVTGSNGMFDLGKSPSRGNLTEEASYMAQNFKTLPSWGIITALAFGLAITVMAYASGHLSGGQMNPAVTLGLTLAGALPPIQCVANICAQVVGAILGAAFLRGTIPNGASSALGSNSLSPGVSNGNAFLGEAVMTFVLVLVVLETAVSKKSSTIRAQAPLAIGFAVFTAHAVLLPIDGCSINPARSLGPAIVSGTWPTSFWVFVVGPFVGSIFAVPFHMFFSSAWDSTTDEELEHDDPLSLPHESFTGKAAASPMDSPAKGAAHV